MSIPKQLKEAASQVEETSRRIDLSRMKRMHAEALAARIALENSPKSKRWVLRPVRDGADLSPHN